jgi:hypothetical protein
VRFAGIVENVLIQIIVEHHQSDSGFLGRSTKDKGSHRYELIISLTLLWCEFPINVSAI